MANDALQNWQRREILLHPETDVAIDQPENQFGPVGGVPAEIGDGSA